MVSARRIPEVELPRIVREPEVLGSYLEDASGQRPGWAAGLARVTSEAEAAAVIRACRQRGDAVLSLATDLMIDHPDGSRRACRR